MSEASHSRVVTRNWNIFRNKNYDVENGIIYYTEELKSNLRVYNDAYILVSGDIVVVTARNANSNSSSILKWCIIY